MANVGRVPVLNDTINNLQPQIAPIINRTSLLFSQSGLRDEALKIFIAAQKARNLTIETEQRVSSIEEGLVNVASNIEGTVENIKIGEEALSNAESKCKYFYLACTDIHTCIIGLVPRLIFIELCEK